MTISKRVILAAFIAAVLQVLAPSAALAAGSTRIVDDDYPSASACKGAGYATIQAAANSIAPGQSGTIKVCAGTYTENVLISGLGKIKLLGLPGATIVAPAGATPPVIAANTTRLTVQGFTLDGSGNTLSGGIILLDNSSGVVMKNVLQNGIDTWGVYAYMTSGARTVKVTRNVYMGVGGGVYSVNAGGALSTKVTNNDFTGGVIGVTIGAGPGLSATAAVTGNHLQGTDVGIQVMGINKVKVSRNKVEGFNTGMLLMDSSRSTLSKNKVHSTTLGVVISGSSANASSNKVTGNTIEAAGNNFIGIDVVADTGMAADLNLIKGNTITDPGASYSSIIGVKLNNTGGTINGTQIKGNKLINIDTMIDASGDSGTVENGNTCTPGVCVI